VPWNIDTTFHSYGVSTCAVADTTNIQPLRGCKTRSPTCMSASSVTWARRNHATHPWRL
jgi:hypothetical protein